MAGVQHHVAFRHAVVIIETCHDRNLACQQLVPRNPNRNAAGIQVLEIRDPGSDRLHVGNAAPMQRNDREIVIVNGGKQRGKVHVVRMGVHAKTKRVKVEMSLAVNRPA